MAKGDDARDDLAPVPQTQDAFDWLRTFGTTEIEETTRAMGRRVRSIAPDCVAISVAAEQGDLTFTLAADTLTAVLLDAVQYLDGGPCEEAIRQDRRQETTRLATDEDRWQMFARASSAAGIESTLSMPLLTKGVATGGVNLYGSTADAFEGHHDELAQVCGAWAGGAVTNADLAFTSRVRAAATPDRLADRTDIDLAAGVVSESQQADVQQAGLRMRDAATRAGVSHAEFARFVLDCHARGNS